MSRRTDYCRDELPVRTVRPRTRGSRTINMIKIRLGGPKSGRWVNYARWWWENNRGPIPEGMRVAHVDGDSLNDDPSNLVLATADDVLCMCMDRTPGLEERMRRNQAAATSEHNRLRGRLNRLTKLNGGMWYLVDHAAWTIDNRPTRQQWHAYQQAMPALRGSPNGVGIHAAALGWPELPHLAAMILDAIWDGPMDTKQILARVKFMRSIRGLSPLRSKGPLYSAMSLLHVRGLARRSGTLKGGCAVQEITQAARASRGPWTASVAMRGRDLATRAYAEYRRINPGQRQPRAVVRRPKAQEQAA